MMTKTPDVCGCLWIFEAQVYYHPKPTKHPPFDRRCMLVALMVLWVAGWWAAKNNKRLSSTPLACGRSHPNTCTPHMAHHTHTQARLGAPQSRMKQARRTQRRHGEIWGGVIWLATWLWSKISSASPAAAAASTTQVKRTPSFYTCLKLALLHPHEAGPT